MKKHILLIDDDPLVAKSLTNLLVRSGYEVTPVTSAEEGVGAARARDFDVVISDHCCPNIS